MTVRVVIEVGDDFIETIAELAAAIAVNRLKEASIAHTSPYLSVSEAADYLRCRRQRIYDLLSSGKLTRHKDGSRVLVGRAELQAYAATERRSGTLPSRCPVRGYTA